LSELTEGLLSDEIIAAREVVERFMRDEVVPVMDGFESRREFPYALVRKAGELGLYGSIFPDWIGGTDMGFLAAAVIAEELARRDARFASSTNQQGGTCPLCIFAAGSESQVQNYVPRLLSGETIGMLSLSESGGGSDPVGNMKTTAKRDGDVYRLNGSKMWTTLANRCDVGLIFAKTDVNAGVKGITAFIIEPKKSLGFEARPIPMHGLSQALDSCAVFLDDVVLPVANRLGEEGEGFKIAMHAMQSGRLNVAARSVGIAQACLDEALRYLNERTLRGKAIGTFQMIQADLAQIVSDIEASRLLVYRAAQLMDEGRPSNRLASIVKYHASMTAKNAAEKAQQFFGGYGLAKESRVSWLTSYAYLYFNGEGSTNVQKVIIAEDALGYKQADRHAGKLRYRNPRNAKAFV
jgi:isovaleryl-CoA dehydrogenase